MAPFLFQTMANTLGLHVRAVFRGVGWLFWTAGLIAGAASWWISGRLLGFVEDPVPPVK